MHGRQGRPLEADVDRLAVHVQAVRGDAAAPAPEHGVGRRRPVAADHLERPGQRQALLQQVDDVEQPGIDDADLAGAPVAQDPVDLEQALRLVAAIGEVGRAQPFAGVLVVDDQPPLRRAAGEGRSRRPSGEAGRRAATARTKPRRETGLGSGVSGMGDLRAGKLLLP